MANLTLDGKNSLDDHPFACSSWIMLHSSTVDQGCSYRHKTLHYLHTVWIAFAHRENNLPGMSATGCILLLNQHCQILLLNCIKNSTTLIVLFVPPTLHQRTCACNHFKTANNVVYDVLVHKESVQVFLVPSKSCGITTASYCMQTYCRYCSYGKFLTTPNKMEMVR